MRRFHLAVLLALCACVASCGNKGQLVQPDKTATQDSAKK